MIALVSLGGLILVGALTGRDGSDGTDVPDSHTLVYRVDGRSHQADITHENHSGDASEETGVSLPGEKGQGGELGVDIRKEKLVKKLLGLIDPENMLAGPINTYMAPKGWEDSLRAFIEANPRKVANAVEAWRQQVAGLDEHDQYFAKAGAGSNNLTSFFQNAFPELKGGYITALAEAGELSRSQINSYTTQGLLAAGE